MDKPFAESCEQNKVPILEVLQKEFAGTRAVLEIGSGTGQHAVFFAAALRHLQWHTSDLPESHRGIRQWLDEAALPNLFGPYVLDVDQRDWPVQQVDGVFSANSAHIMSEASAIRMVAGAARVLTAAGRFCLYGPFLYDGRHTCDSNRRFDAWLKARDPLSGVRDANQLTRHAAEHGLTLVRDHAMPVNNRLLVWEKTS